MKIGKILRRIAMLVSLLMLCLSTIGTTYGFIVTSTDSLITVFLPDEIKITPVTPKNVDVCGVKLLEGREWQNGDSFTFVLESQNGDGWTRLGEKTVSYDADNTDFNKFDFNDVFSTLIFDKVGTYIFRTTAVVGDLENVNYDRTVNYFTIIVTDTDADRKLEISSVSGTQNVNVTTREDSFEILVTFSSVFSPNPQTPDPITVNIGIDKKVENKGSLSSGLEGFGFVLENVLTSEKAHAVSDSEGRASFTLSFTKADVGKTYFYKLWETDQGVNGMTYDKSVHEIMVSVSVDESNKLKAFVMLDGTATEVLNVVFENVYDASEIPSPPTGDSALIFWFIMMTVSGASLVTLVVYEKKVR